MIKYMDWHNEAVCTTMPTSFPRAAVAAVLRFDARFSSSLGTIVHHFYFFKNLLFSYMQTMKFIVTKSVVSGC